MVGHEDVCFHGERDSKTDTYKYFRGSPSTSITIGELTGYDPIALIPAVTTYIKNNITGHKFFRPKVVVVDGITKDPDEITEVTSIWDHSPDGIPDGELETYSDPGFYATYKGDGTDGVFYIEALSISNVSCTLTFGKGGNRNRVIGTTISLDATFAYGGTNPPETLNIWGDARIRVRQPPDSEWGTFRSRNTPRENGTQSYSWTVDQDLSGSLDIDFVLDYLFGTGSDEAYDRVHDPGKNIENEVRTTAGYDGDEWHPTKNVSEKLGDGKFPVAHSALRTVTCPTGRK